MPRKSKNYTWDEVCPSRGIEIFRTRDPVENVGLVYGVFATFRECQDDLLGHLTRKRDKLDELIEKVRSMRARDVTQINNSKFDYEYREEGL